MAIKISGKFKPYGDFKLVDAEDVEMPDGTSLADFNPGSGLPEVNDSYNGMVLGVEDGTWKLVEVKQDDGLSEVTILEEQQIDTFAEDESLGGLYCADIVFGEDHSHFTLILGETYKVAWDNEIYDVVAQDASVMITGAILLGNGTLFELPGNGEPFCIGCTPYGVVILSIDSQDASHRVGIYQKVAKQELPAVSASNNGNLLQVVDGKWVAAPIAGSAVATYIDEYISAALEGDY